MSICLVLCCKLLPSRSSNKILMTVLLVIWQFCFVMASYWLMLKLLTVLFQLSRSNMLVYVLIFTTRNYRYCMVWSRRTSISLKQSTTTFCFPYYLWQSKRMHLCKRPLFTVFSSAYTYMLLVVIKYKFRKFLLLDLKSVCHCHPLCLIISANWWAEQGGWKAKSNWSTSGK